MKFCKILSELDSEEKAREWMWLAKFDGKEFICLKCRNEDYYQHYKNLEVRECKKCHFEIRLRADTIFQKSKTTLLHLVKGHLLCYARQTRYFSLRTTGKSWNEILRNNLGVLPHKIREALR